MLDDDWSIGEKFPDSPEMLCFFFPSTDCVPIFAWCLYFNMSTRVYLGRLARDCRDRDIEKLFRGYGDIREINLKNGFGFVEFRDNRDAEDVVYDFHGKEFLGER